MSKKKYRSSPTQNIKQVPSWNQVKVWFVWVRKERSNGLENVDLRSVCFTKELAELHQDMIIRDEPDASGIWIEERETDHLYAQRDARLAFRLLDISNKWVRE